MKRYRKTERGGELFSVIVHEQALAGKTTGILKRRDLIPWESTRAPLENLTSYATRDWSKGGKSQGLVEKRKKPATPSCSISS